MAVVTLGNPGSPMRLHCHGFLGKPCMETQLTKLNGLGKPWDMDTEEKITGFLWRMGSFVRQRMGISNYYLTKHWNLF